MFLLLLCWLNFFKFNIAVRLNNLFDGRCGTKNFWLKAAFNVFLAVHHSGASRAECSSKHDDSQPLQRTRQAPGRRIHVDDVDGDGNRHDMQSEGKNPATHVNRRGAGSSVPRWHLTCCFLRVISHITFHISSAEDIVLNHNNNNNSQSMNNNSAAKSFDKSTQTMECGECKLASEKLLMEKCIAVETQTDFTQTNLHNDSICCLNRIPYADMSNSPISRSLSYQCDKTKTSLDNCNESLNGSNEDVSQPQPPTAELPNNVYSTHTTENPPVVTKDAADKCQPNKGVDIL